MKGDFSRDTFDRLNQFRRVLMQQGRVTLDADWNEQVSILLESLRVLTEDLIGPHGGTGFAITPQAGNNQRLDDLEIGFGNYYVDGLLCTNDKKPDPNGKVEPMTYYSQPYRPDPDVVGEKLPRAFPLLVYLEVWERHLTYAETASVPFRPTDPNIREVALNGPDTTTRAKLTWQVKTKPLTKEENETLETANNLKASLDTISPVIDRLRPSKRRLDDLVDWSQLLHIGDALEHPVIKALNAAIEVAQNTAKELESVKQPLPKGHELVKPLEDLAKTISGLAKIEAAPIGTKIDTIKKSLTLLGDQIEGVAILIAALQVSNDQARREAIEAMVKDKPTLSRAYLEAFTRPAGKTYEDPCNIAPDARYRGAENQLYRVEVHKEGKAGEATFKWSRDNGSVIFPVRKLADNTAMLEHLGRDSRLSLAQNNWVELLDDDLAQRGGAGWLAQVDTVNQDDLTVVLKPVGRLLAYGPSDYEGKHVLLRRWDYRGDKTGSTSQSDLPALKDGALVITEGNPITLEYGVQIRFQAAPAGQEPYYYRAGDYWLIPARVVTGDVEWPKGPDGKPLGQRPHGVDHHYAPLAIISLNEDKTPVQEDCRHVIIPLGLSKQEHR